MLMSAELKGCVTWFIYFLDLLLARYICARLHHCRICVTDFREGGLFAPPPILEQPRKIPSWIGLRDKAFKIANDLKCDGYQRGLALVFYKFFDKKSSGGGVDAEPNYQLENELQKKIIRRLKRRKVYLSFRDNIWGVDLADVQSLSK